MSRTEKEQVWIWISKTSVLSEMNLYIYIHIYLDLQVGCLKWLSRNVNSTFFLGFYIPGTLFWRWLVYINISLTSPTRNPFLPGFLSANKKPKTAEVEGSTVKRKKRRFKLRNREGSSGAKGFKKRGVRTPRWLICKKARSRNFSGSRTEKKNQYQISSFGDRPIVEIDQNDSNFSGCRILQNRSRKRLVGSKEVKYHRGSRGL